MEFARRVIRPILDPVERLTDALADAARRERTALLVLAAYAAVWTLYGVDGLQIRRQLRFSCMPRAIVLRQRLAVDGGAYNRYGWPEDQ
jgi:hypothetical protein